MLMLMINNDYNDKMSDNAAHSTTVVTLPLQKSWQIFKCLKAFKSLSQYSRKSHSRSKSSLHLLKLSAMLTPNIDP